MHITYSNNQSVSCGAQLVGPQICTIFYPDTVLPIRIICSSCRRRQAC